MAATTLSGDLAVGTFATTPALQCKENAFTKERESSNLPVVPTTALEETVKGESFCTIEADVEHERISAEVENRGEAQIFKLYDSTSAFESGCSGWFGGPEDADVAQQMFRPMKLSHAYSTLKKLSGGRRHVFLVPLVRQVQKRRRELRSSPCEKGPGRMRCLAAKGVNAGKRQSNRLITFFLKERQSSNQEIDAVLAPVSEAQPEAFGATVQGHRNAEQNDSLLESRPEIGEIAKPVTESQCEVVATALQGTNDTHQPPPSSLDIDETPPKNAGACFSAIAAALQESKTLIALEPSLAKPSLAEDACTFGDGETSMTILKTQFAAACAALEDSRSSLIIKTQTAHQPPPPESRRFSNAGVRWIHLDQRWIKLGAAGEAAHPQETQKQPCIDVRPTI